MNLVSINFFHLLEFPGLLLLQVYRGCCHLFKTFFMHLFYESIVVSVLVLLLFGLLFSAETFDVSLFILQACHAIALYLHETQSNLTVAFPLGGLYWVMISNI